MTSCLDNPLLEELGPLLLPPRARDLIRDKPIEQDRRRDVDTVLPTELDCDALSVSLDLGSSDCSFHIIPQSLLSARLFVPTPRF